MTGVLRAEFTRFRVRRVLALLMILAVLSGAGVAALSAWETRPPSAAERATAEAQAQIERDRADIEADLAKCLADPERYLGTNATQDSCRAALTAAPKSFLPREPLSLRGTLHGNGIGLALLVAALLIIAACVSVGTDTTSGSITNQVLFAPSRTRLWTAKALAVALWSLLVSTVAIGGFWVALYLVAADRDVPHGSAIVDDVAWHAVRAVVFCVGAAVGAFALTTVLRSAAATLGILFAYAVGGELILALLPVDDIARWTLGTNVFGWLETRLEYFGTGNDLAHLGHAPAGAYLAVLLVVAVLGGLLSFRRRDL